MEGRAHALDFATLFDRAPVGLAVLDRDLRYLFCNQALAEMNGLPATEHIGKTLADIVPALADKVAPQFRRVLETGKPLVDLHLSGMVPDTARAAGSWLVSAVPMGGREGDSEAVMLSVQTVTALEETQAALRQSEAILHASHDASFDGFTILRAIRNADGGIDDFVWEFANPVAERILGRGPLIGQRLLAVLPANREQEELFPRYVRILEARGAEEIELRYDDGVTDGWFHNSTITIDPDRIAVSFRDITARKLAEERLRLLTLEFRHRVKNLLAIIGSLVWHAGKAARDVQGFTEIVQRQLMAMASAQDQIGRQPSGQVELDSLVRGTLAPFGVKALRITGGPALALDPECIVPLALALHELATNAMKYGALTTSAGQVELSWQCTGQRVTMHWREQGGPTVTAPERPGFGTRLLEIIQRSLPGGRIALDFAPDGLCAVLDFDCAEDAPLSG